MRTATIAAAVALTMLSGVAHAGSPRGTPPVRSVAWPTESSHDTDAPAQNTTSAPPSPGVPSPRASDPSKVRLHVAVGLDPSAPGSKAERELVRELERQTIRSTNPTTKVRRVRAGAPSPREVCRGGGYELVILVGYLPKRDDPVLLVHDCVLDMPLGVRAIGAAEDPRLVSALWAEHDALVRDGVKERRRLRRLTPRARTAIVASAAAVAIGIAVGVLGGSALRDEKVVIKVGP